MSVVLFSATRCVVRWVTEFWLVVVHAASGGKSERVAIHVCVLRCAHMEKLLIHTTADFWVTFEIINHILLSKYIENLI